MTAYMASPLSGCRGRASITPPCRRRRVIPGDDPAPRPVPRPDEEGWGPRRHPGVMGVPPPVAAGPAPAPDGRGPGPGAWADAVPGVRAEARYAPMRIGWLDRAAPAAS